MFGIPIRVPVLIVILLAAFWMFVLAWWKPELLEQKQSSRVYVSLLEGMLSGALWGILLSHLSNDPIEGLLMSALFAGVIWFCVVIYSRNHYTQAFDTSPKRKMKPVERSY